MSLNFKLPPLDSVRCAARLNEALQSGELKNREHPIPGFRKRGKTLEDFVRWALACANGDHNGAARILTNALCVVEQSNPAPVHLAAFMSRAETISWKAQSNVCWFCLQRPATSRDHFRPQKLGIIDGENVIPACGPCNSRKGSALIFEWVPRLFREPTQDELNARERIKRNRLEHRERRFRGRFSVLAEQHAKRRSVTKPNGA